MDSSSKIGNGGGNGSRERRKSEGSGNDEALKPFKVVDAGRDYRMGLTASTLAELIEKARGKFEIGPHEEIRVVLEVDGTEIDDNDYFITLERDTSLMILCNEERWTPYKSVLTLGLAVDSGTNSTSNGSSSTPGSPVEELVWRLHQDLSFFPWLTPNELETISKMDTEEMKKIIPDVKFLEFLQDLSERYLQDKDKSEGQTLSSNGYENGHSKGIYNNGTSNNTSSSILNDPIKLIRMYSKSNHYLNNCDQATTTQIQNSHAKQSQQHQSFRTN